MKNRKCLIAGLAIASLMSNVHSKDGWYLDFAIATGGDDLAEVEVEEFDGDRDTVDITAGGGVSFAGGYSFSFAPDSPVGGVVSLGYKTDGVFGSNGSASFSRLPIDASIFYRTQWVQWGVGVTYELNPELDLEDVGIRSIDFDNAEGYFVQVDWRATPQFAVGLRYTAIDYSVSDNAFEGEDIDGNNTSLRMSFVF